MNSEQLQQARSFIEQKRYDEARAILRTMPSDLTAQKWLLRLEQIAPENMTSSKQSIAVKQRSTSNPLLWLMLLVIAVLLGASLYELYRLPDRIAVAQLNLQPTPTVNIIQTSTHTPTIMPTFVPTTTPVVAELLSRWEYLTFNYSQGNTFEDERRPYELAYSNDLFYDVALFGVDACLEEELFSDQVNCWADNFRGLDYFLDTYGNDQWELISLVDKSTEYSYRVEAIFKRLSQQSPTPRPRDSGSPNT